MDPSISYSASVRREAIESRRRGEREITEVRPPICSFAVPAVDLDQQWRSTQMQRVELHCPFQMLLGLSLISDSGINVAQFRLFR
jgi:hypothetical protein